MRFCVDYRKLNSITAQLSYPLPKIDTCLESLGEAQYFSTLDLSSGYWRSRAMEDRCQPCRHYQQTVYRQPDRRQRNVYRQAVYRTVHLQSSASYRHEYRRSSQ